MTFYTYNGAGDHNKNNWFVFKENMKLAGWTIPKSSDGLTYNASGDQITVNAISGAGGVGTSSWFVASHPTLDGYQRHWCFQFNSSGDARIKLSWSGFSSGSPGITRVPSATDEQVMFGGGTDASPSYTAFFSNSIQGSTSVFIRCGDVSEKYSFCMFGVLPLSITYGTIVFERLNNTHALDIDPYYYYVSGSTSSGFDTTSHPWYNTGGAQGYVWYKKGLSGETFIRMGCGSISSTGVNANYKQTMGFLGTNPYDGKIQTAPLMFFRGSGWGAQLGWKGQMTNFLLAGLLRASATCVTKDSTNDYIYLGSHIILKWDGSSPKYV